MGTVTGPPPSPPDADLDAKALEALIEEARRRARRRRRGYVALALAGVAAGLLGVQLFNDGGGSSGSADRGGQSRSAAAIGSQLADASWRAAPGLEGARISALAVDTRRPDRVFAATLEAGLFGSATGGRTWRQLDLGPAVTRVDALAVAPGEPNTIYAGTGRGVFKTTDGGSRWEPASSGLFRKATADTRDHRASEGYISALAVNQRHAEVAYAGTWEKGVFKTEDGGRSWRNLGPKAVRVSALALGRATSEVIYAGTDRGVLESSDGGKTWNAIGPRADVTTLALDPKHPDTVYAGTVQRGVFRTTDGGASWRSLGLKGGTSSGLALDPNNARIAYAAGWDKGVFKTEDGGRSWRLLDAGYSSSALALDPRKPSTIFVGNSGRDPGEEHVSKSVDGGLSWRPMDAGFSAARISALAVDARGLGTAYAAVVGRGLFRRVDGRWRSANKGLTADSVQDVVVDPGDPATIYAGTDGALFKSTNGGMRWGVASVSYTPFGTSALAANPRTPATVYAIAVSDPDESRDGGTLTDPRRGLVPIETRVFKSTDGGHSWPTDAPVQSIKVRPGGIAAEAARASLLTIDPLNPEVLYSGGLGVVKSVDGGRTWRQAGLARRPIFALALDPNETAVVYAGTNAGLFKSTDAGASWRLQPGALQSVRVEALAVDPGHHRTAYAATDRGVFWSVDGGDRWQRFTRLPDRPFKALAVDRSAGVLYAGAYGGGIYELSLAP